MNRATCSPIRVITAAQQPWNPRITSLRSSGSSVAARAVEPTRSQKRTVSWRLSASDCGAAGAVAGAAAGITPDTAAIALRIRFRWPSATPNFSRSASVTSGRISKLIAFLAKMAAYWARPIPSSQVFSWSFTLMIDRRRIVLLFPQLAPPTRRSDISFATKPTCVGGLGLRMTRNRRSSRGHFTGRQVLGRPEPLQSSASPLTQTNRDQLGRLVRSHMLLEVKMRRFPAR
jgi:hypothetical protein